MATRRQHTIPQFYLKPFLSPGWVYRRGASVARYVKNPRNVAVQTDYYSKNQSERRTLDDQNTFLESEGAPAFRKLIEDHPTFTDDDWVTLSYLIANFVVRTPVVIDEISAAMSHMATRANELAQRMKERLEEALLAGSDLSEFSRSEGDDDSPSMTVGEMNEHAGRLRSVGGHRIAASITFSALIDIAKCIQRMRLLVLEAPLGHFFVTSDRPLSLRSRITNSPVGAGWAKSDALGCMALDPGHFLLMYYDKSPGIQTYQPTLEELVGLNFETLLYADQEVYSPFEYQEADDWMKACGR